MLTELHIENLGVIERLELVVGGGLTVLTGETGAGKTMLVEAIELLVGGRADVTSVRTGAAEARVDGRFVVPDGDSDREMVLSRVVPADGRSRAYVDGRPSTVSALADATAGLVDLHGQHAHQSLLSATAQRAALDLYCGVDLSPLRRARARVTELDAALATLGGDERARAREIDLLRYQVSELDSAAISGPDEDERLAAEEETLADAVAHRDAGAAALGLLGDDDGVRDLIARAAVELDQRTPFRPVADRLAAVLAEIDDAATDLRAIVEVIEEDPERLDELRTRRQLLRDLCRKYGDDLAEVMAFHTTAAERLTELESFEQRAEELDLERRAALDAVRREAEKVGARRRSAAPELAATVRDGLRSLAMPDADVAVSVGDGDDDPAGERVEFLLAANPGSPMLPLSRVASGGELARAMLALRLALIRAASGQQANDRPQVATLVFDEVDAGIGGAAAVAVAGALADLGGHHQVLVVTHLAQVAATADDHIVVSKSVEAGITRAVAHPVAGDERMAEVARMLAGSDTTEAREHASSLLAGSARGSRNRR